LFPVFARARENARRASCQSNLKQIGIGFMQYTQDYDERLPLQDYTVKVGTTDYHCFWAEQLQPYVKSYQVYLCPSLTNTSGTAWYTTPANGYDKYKVQYNVNTLFPKNIPGYNTIPNYTNYDIRVMSDSGGVSATLVALDKPTETIFAYDANNSTYYYGWTQGNPTGSSTYVAPRHLDGSNWLFCDGHVKWYRPESVSKYWFAAKKFDETW
jgi:prepilin-type processing-associated H-X9-DG protein